MSSTPAPGGVVAMFDRIAPVYDVMNTVMTAGIDRRWRTAALREAKLRPGMRVLDVATGTGKLALAAAAAVGPRGSVTGLDASRAMLRRAARAESRRTVRREAGSPISWTHADAMSMPFAAASFDAVTIGFGLRNLPGVGAALAEMARVLAPGGRVVILEVGEPAKGLPRLLFRTWFRRIIPLLGRLAGRAAAYEYLPESVRRYPPPEEVAALMRQSGLEEVRWRWLTSGLVTLHHG
ncbi:MAG TPA: ubiquinone/menaquinone biosynthesis methyltransferase, partial [Candidatus Limnocylindria bacterium]|nr:ubiquinone/menaquinone biosynthesis methyltransferase [Candidatus Limnocylindria bacterium]